VSPEISTQAKRYLELGWKLAPIKAGSKEPYHRLNNTVMGTTATNTLRTMPLTEQHVERWFELDPNCGVGVYVNGPGEPRCIDFDGTPECPLPTTEELAGLPLAPMMYTPREHGGWRMFYASHDDDLKGLTHRWGEFPTQAVLPPSLHTSGKPYSWAIDPWELGTELPELRPEHLLLLVAAEKSASAPGGASSCSYHSRTRSRTLVGQSFPAPGPLEAEDDGARLDLQAFDRDDDAVRAMARVLGLPLDRDFSCPFHPPDTNPSACLMCGDNDGVWFVWCGHPGALTYTLADVRAARAGVQIERSWVEYSEWRRKRAIQGPELAVYKLRLLHEASLIKPFTLPEVDLPPLADDEQRLWEGFRLLVSLRWRYSGRPGSPVMFTNTFAAKWCGLGERHRVGKAIRSLQEHGLMRLVDQQRHCRRWVPAPYQPAQQPRSALVQRSRGVGVATPTAPHRSSFK
jgi:hypothetical protein